MARRTGLMVGGLRPIRKIKPLKNMTSTVKLRKLGELQSMEKEISTLREANNKQFENTDKLFDKARKLRQQLGI